ncbi:hypothetical protein V6N13_114412 [Hibiscus sabdariffa]|uniref:Uncharacterized protein n=1 Tax=Hibiscus sabdariffa TaxID=183260 RepID=A0ABR2U209_9ROSI
MSSLVIVEVKLRKVQESWKSHLRGSSWSFITSSELPIVRIVELQLVATETCRACVGVPQQRGGKLLLHLAALYNPTVLLLCTTLLDRALSLTAVNTKQSLTGINLFDRPTQIS